METLGQRIKLIRDETGMKRREFAEYFGIPVRTIEDWEYEKRIPPEYVVRLMAYYVKFEKQRENRSVKSVASDNAQRNILITEDDQGIKLVVIPQIIFPGKRKISWEEVENYLLKYVGEVFAVADTDDMVFVGKDFPDEYTGSVYSRGLTGPVARAKANIVQGLPELIEIGTKKRWSEDYQKRHGQKAARGWYRYDTRFGLPVSDENGKIVRYNVYRAVIIVRYASDDKLYLYDIQNIKKETSYPS